MALDDFGDIRQGPGVDGATAGSARLTGPQDEFGR